MARLCPSRPPHMAVNGGAYAEIGVLKTLEVGLPDAYTLFHNVEWSRGAGPLEQHGEIDLVLVNQQGDVLLIEVKSGAADVSNGAIVKTYDGRVRNVTAQVRQQYDAMRGRLQGAGLTVKVHHLLVLPNARVRSETAQWPRERIVDSEDYAQIVSRIAALLGPGDHDAGQQTRVLDFFAGRLQIEPDVSALGGRLQQASTHLSAGLATWVPRITAPSGLIRVAGTAGSGKTQLALRLLRDADAAGQKAAYFCFNRALADHISRVAPVRTPAETFHEYALRVALNTGRTVDFSEPAAFDTLAANCIDWLGQASPDLDLIVLDEMQDLQPEWVSALLSRVKADGRAVMLEDPDQQLYRDRVGFELPDAVAVTCHENYRTPRALVDLINLLRLTPDVVQPLSPFEGEVCDPIVYQTPEQIPRRTVEAVQRCLARGFALQDIAVISLCGRERSVLQGLDRLGNWTLRRFTGSFDAGSAPVWTDGPLLIDSVRRFKGQAAPAVVLTECDIAQLDALNRRLLFVGFTRARVHLEWVISAQTVDVISRAAQAGADGN